VAQPAALPRRQPRHAIVACASMPTIRSLRERAASPPSMINLTHSSPLMSGGRQLLPPSARVAAPPPLTSSPDTALLALPSPP